MIQCIDVNGNASLPIECGNDFKIGSKMKFSFDMKTMDICKIIIWQVLDNTGNDIQNTWHLDSIQLVDNSYISLDGIHVSNSLRHVPQRHRIWNFWQKFSEKILLLQSKPMDNFTKNCTASTVINKINKYLLRHRRCHIDVHYGCCLRSFDDMSTTQQSCCPHQVTNIKVDIWTDI